MGSESSSTLCEDAGSGADLDALNERLLAAINDSGRLYLTKTRAAGRVLIRFVIGQTYTTWDHVREGWEEVVRTARQLGPRAS